MIDIVNFAITFAILLIGNVVVPNYIICTGDWKCIVIVSVLYYMIKFLFELPITGLTVLMCSKGYRQNSYKIISSAIVFAVIACFVTSYLALMVCSSCLTWFSIVGKHTYFILVFVLYILKIKTKHKARMESH